MAITQSLATSFKVELLDGIHDFTAGSGDTFYMALYTSSASLGPTTTVYSTTNETSGTGYTAGGNALSISQSPTSGGTTAFLSFANTTWNSASFTARGGMIYNFTKAGRAVAIFDFGSDKTVVGGTFTITFPAASASTAVIRIA